MNVKKEDLKTAVDQFYKKEILLKLFDKYFLNFIADSYIGQNMNLFEVSVIGSSSKKEVFNNFIFQMYESEEAFLACFNALSEEVQNIFRHIAWKGKFYLSAEDKEKMVHSVKNSFRFQEEPREEYLFFSLHLGKKWDENDKDYFDLDRTIVKTIRNYLEKPSNYYLNPVKNPVYEYNHSSEDEIIEKMRLYINFYKLDGITMSSSNKLLKSVKKEMKKQCDIDEYYKDGGDLEYLKTETIALFLLSLKEESLKEEYFRIQNIKQIVDGFLSGNIFKEEKFNFTTKFLNYLKGVGNIWNEDEHLKEVLDTLRKVLFDLPRGEIVEVGNILDYIEFRDCFTNIISIENVYDYIYINEADYGRSKISTLECYHKYIVVPMFKAFFAILGSFGILDLYYDMPNCKNGLYLKNGYLTKYDGIKYIRLSKLGEYTLDKRQEYNFGELGEEVEVCLDEDRLIVTLIGDAPVKSMFLEQIAYKIACNKFKLDNQSILRNIESLNDLNKRIKDFKNKITDKLPKIWEEFFEEIKNKVNLINPVPKMNVFKIAENRELINIIAKDEILKKYILKAEGFYILVPEEDTKVVIKRLESFGYFNENV